MILFLKKVEPSVPQSDLNAINYRTDRNAQANKLLESVKKNVSGGTDNRITEQNLLDYTKTTVKKNDLLLNFSKLSSEGKMVFLEKLDAKAVATFISMLHTGLNLEKNNDSNQVIVKVLVTYLNRINDVKEKEILDNLEQLNVKAFNFLTKQDKFIKPFNIDPSKANVVVAEEGLITDSVKEKSEELSVRNQGFDEKKYFPIQRVVMKTIPWAYFLGNRNFTAITPYDYGKITPKIINGKYMPTEWHREDNGTIKPSDGWFKGNPSKGIPYKNPTFVDNTWQAGYIKFYPEFAKAKQSLYTEYLENRSGFNPENWITKSGILKYDEKDSFAVALWQGLAQEAREIKGIKEKETRQNLSAVKKLASDLEGHASAESDPYDKVLNTVFQSVQNDKLKDRPIEEQQMVFEHILNEAGLEKVSRGELSLSEFKKNPSFYRDLIDFKALVVYFNKSVDTEKIDTSSNQKVFIRTRFQDVMDNNIEKIMEEARNISISESAPTDANKNKLDSLSLKVKELRGKFEKRIEAEKKRGRIDDRAGYGSEYLKTVAKEYQIALDRLETVIWLKKNARAEEKIIRDQYLKDPKSWETLKKRHEELAQKIEFATGEFRSNLPDGGPKANFLKPNEVSYLTANITNIKSSGSIANQLQAIENFYKQSEFPGLEKFNESFTPQKIKEAEEDNTLRSTLEKEYLSHFQKVSTKTYGHDAKSYQVFGETSISAYQKKNVKALSDALGQILSNNINSVREKLTNMTKQGHDLTEHEKALAISKEKYTLNIQDEGSVGFAEEVNESNRPRIETQMKLDQFSTEIMLMIHEGKSNEMIFGKINEAKKADEDFPEKQINTIILSDLSREEKKSKIKNIVEKYLMPVKVRNEQAYKIYVSEWHKKSELKKSGTTKNTTEYREEVAQNDARLKKRQEIVNEVDKSRVKSNAERKAALTRIGVSENVDGQSHIAGWTKANIIDAENDLKLENANNIHEAMNKFESVYNAYRLSLENFQSAQKDFDQNKNNENYEKLNSAYKDLKTKYTELSKYKTWPAELSGAYMPDGDLFAKKATAGKGTKISVKPLNRNIQEQANAFFRKVDEEVKPAVRNYCELVDKYTYIQGHQSGVQTLTNFDKTLETKNQKIKAAEVFYKNHPTEEQLNKKMKEIFTDAKDSFGIIYDQQYDLTSDRKALDRLSELAHQINRASTEKTNNRGDIQTRKKRIEQFENEIINNPSTDPVIQKHDNRIDTYEKFVKNKKAEFERIKKQILERTEKLNFSELEAQIKQIESLTNFSGNLDSVYLGIDKEPNKTTGRASYTRGTSVGDFTVAASGNTRNESANKDYAPADNVNVQGTTGNQTTNTTSGGNTGNTLKDNFGGEVSLEWKARVSQLPWLSDGAKKYIKELRTKVTGGYDQKTEAGRARLVKTAAQSQTVQSINITVPSWSYGSALNLTITPPPGGPSSGYTLVITTYDRTTGLPAGPSFTSPALSSGTTNIGSLDDSSGLIVKAEQTTDDFQIVMQLVPPGMPVPTNASVTAQGVATADLRLVGTNNVISNPSGFSGISFTGPAVPQETIDIPIQTTTRTANLRIEAGALFKVSNAFEGAYLDITAGAAYTKAWQKTALGSGAAYDSTGAQMSDAAIQQSLQQNGIIVSDLNKDERADLILTFRNYFIQKTKILNILVNAQGQWNATQGRGDITVAGGIQKYIDLRKNIDEQIILNLLYSRRLDFVSKDINQDQPLATSQNLGKGEVQVVYTRKGWFAGIKGTLNVDERKTRSTDHAIGTPATIKNEQVITQTAEAVAGFSVDNVDINARAGVSKSSDRDQLGVTFGAGAQYKFNVQPKEERNENIETGELSGYEQDLRNKYREDFRKNTGITINSTEAELRAWFNSTKSEEYDSILPLYRDKKGSNAFKILKAYRDSIAKKDGKFDLFDKLCKEFESKFN